MSEVAVSFLSELLGELTLSINLFLYIWYSKINKYAFKVQNLYRMGGILALRKHEYLH